MMNSVLTDNSRLFIGQRAPTLALHRCRAKVMTKALEKCSSCVERVAFWTRQRVIRNVRNSLVL